MKIVINKCFGGFGISQKAVLYLIRKNSNLIENMTFSEYTGGRTNKLEDYELKKWHEVGDGYYSTFHSVLYDKDCKNVWFDKARDYDNRIHPDLIEVVELLGDDANGEFAELRVIEIPDDVDYDIDDYDGIESVHEVHRSW